MIEKKNGEKSARGKSVLVYGIQGGLKGRPLLREAITKQGGDFDRTSIVYNGHQLKAGREFELIFLMVETAVDSRAADVIRSLEPAETFSLRCDSSDPEKLTEREFAARLSPQRMSL